MRWSVLRTATYWTAGALFASGLAWFVLHQWFPSDSDFGPSPGPAEPWLMRLHGAAAMANLIVLGALLQSHVLPSWRHGYNRRSGLLLAAALLALVVTGYLLYYSGGETARAIASWVHLGLGLMLPAAVAAHVRGARRARRQRLAAAGRDAPA